MSHELVFKLPYLRRQRRLSTARGGIGGVRDPRPWASDAPAGHVSRGFHRSMVARRRSAEEARR